MGIDYDANYGIGYEVKESAEIDVDALEDGLHEYLYMDIGKKFEVFETGSYMTGEIEGTYLTIKDPFGLGLDLSSVKLMLDKEISRLKLEAVGEFGLVGGILIS